MRIHFYSMFLILWCSISSAAVSEDAVEGSGKKVTSIEELLQSLSTVDSVMTRRDPFIRVTAPFERPVDSGDIAMSAPILERYPLKEYFVVAVLLGDVYPRALVRTPDPDRKVLIVKEKDKLGSQGGTIKQIGQNGITISQKRRSPLGFVDQINITLSVGTGGKLLYPNGPPSSSEVVAPNGSLSKP